MNIWEEFSQLGFNVIDTAGDLVGGWGDAVTNANAAQAANINASAARIELAKAAFVKDQARKDEMQKVVNNVVYTALTFAGLALLFYFLKNYK